MKLKCLWNEKMKFTAIADEHRVPMDAKPPLGKYCGVTAMVSKTVPISYTVEINGESVGSGLADFS